MTNDLFPAAEDAGVGSDDRPRWLEVRKTMLTASKTAALFGCHPFASPLSIYVDMVMPIAEAPLEPTIFDPMFWGLQLERAVFEGAAKHYGWETRPGGRLLRSKKHAGLGATLDGAVRNGTEWDVYEGKTTSAWRGRDWDEETGKAPEHVLVQNQHQLLVTGAGVCKTFCLIGGQKPCLVEVEASISFQAALIEETEEFMSRVRRFDPPAATANERDRRALERLFPEDPQTAVRLPAEALDWSRELFDLAEQIKRLQRRHDELRNLLRQSIGSATYGLLPEPVEGKSCWRWQEQQRAEHFVKASSSRILLALKHPPHIFGEPQLAAPVPSIAELLARAIVALGDCEQCAETMAPVPKRRRKARR